MKKLAAGGAPSSANRKVKVRTEDQVKIEADRLGPGTEGEKSWRHRFTSLDVQPPGCFLNWVAILGFILTLSLTLFSAGFYVMMQHQSRARAIEDIHEDIKDVEVYLNVLREGLVEHRKQLAQLRCKVYGGKLFPVELSCHIQLEGKTEVILEPPESPQEYKPRP